ncbi:MAG: prepilin-type N-terminal cleavage/methylation domain-containing protein [Candidatus Angelobacter sp.]
MEISKSQNRRANRHGGFALIEVMVAIVILAVGLLGLAALMAQLSGTTSQSRYMGTEVMLASTKLEDLNRLAIGDPRLAAGGSLAADTAGYFDQVQISSTNGGIPIVTPNAPAAASNDMLLFKRRWTVEQNPAGFPVGVSRVTVLVSLLDGDKLSRSETFQTSMVRQ